MGKKKPDTSHKQTAKAAKPQETKSKQVKAVEDKVKEFTPKQAPSKVPRKQGWKLCLEALLMLIWVGASVIVSQLVVGQLMVMIVGAETFVKPIPSAIYSLLSYILDIILVVVAPVGPSLKWLLAQRRSKAGSKKDKDAERIAKVEKPEISIDRTELGLGDWPTWTDIGLAPVGFIVYMILAAGVTALFNLFPWFNAGEAQDLGFNLYSAGFDRVVAFLVMVVVAPVAEEVVFRGWLYGRLRNLFHGVLPKWAGMLLAIFLVSLLFGMVHMQWNVGVNVFALSVVLCGLREITGTIHAGILLHMLKNGVAFFLLYVL